jgi:hypothetical protein
MPIVVVCNACSSRLNVPSKFAGKSINCLSCKESVHVPTTVTNHEQPQPSATDGRRDKRTQTVESAPTTSLADQILYAEPRVSRIRSFLAQRGALTMKELRELRTINVQYGSKIRITGISITVVRGGTSDTIYGIRIEEISPEGKVDDQTFLDFEELEELLAAIDFIYEAATRIEDQVRDYSEIEYSTKEKCRIGFYHSENGQNAFMDVSDGESIFLPVAQLLEIRKSIQVGYDYLQEKKQAKAELKRSNPLP